MTDKKGKDKHSSGDPLKDGDEEVLSLDLDSSEKSHPSDDGKTFVLEVSEVDRVDDEDTNATRVVRGKPQAPLARKSADGYQVIGSELALRQSEHLKVAQKRVEELEREVDSLRRQNEELFSAAEVIRSSKEELEKSFERLKLDHDNLKEIHLSEIQVLRDRSTHRDGEIKELKRSNQDLQERIDQSFQQVRKREKELEHRLEIMKLDGQAVLRSKDSKLLELKEKLDQAQFDNEKLGRKNHSLQKEIQDKEATIRRAVRALRLALVQLEEESSEDVESPAKLKKVK